MPEHVWNTFPVYRFDGDTFEYLLEVFCSEASVPPMGPEQRGRSVSDPTVQNLVSDVLLKNLPDGGVERDRTWLVSLCDPAGKIEDFDDHFVEIYVFDVEAQYFGVSEAGVECEEDQGIVTGASKIGCPQKKLDLFIPERVGRYLITTSLAWSSRPVRFSSSIHGVSSFTGFRTFYDYSNDQPYECTGRDKCTQVMEDESREDADDTPKKHAGQGVK